MNSAPLKLSFTTLGTPGRTLPEIVGLARHYGFSGVDLRCCTPDGEVHPDLSPAQSSEIREQLVEAALEVPSLLCYPDLKLDEPGWAARLARQLGKLLRLAEALGARAIRMFGPPLCEGDDLATFEALKNAIAQALADAPGQSRLLIQNHAGSATVSDCVRLARELDDSRFGVAYSPDHGYAHDSMPLEEQWRFVRPHTGLIYLSDLKRDGDGFRPELPGRGEVPLGETLKALFALGFDGYCSFKWEKLWHPDLAEFEVAVPHFFALAGISGGCPK